MPFATKCSVCGQDFIAIDPPEVAPLCPACQGAVSDRPMPASGPSASTAIQADPPTLRLPMPSADGRTPDIRMSRLGVFALVVFGIFLTALVVSGISFFAMACGCIDPPRRAQPPTESR